MKPIPLFAFVLVFLSTIASHAATRQWTGLSTNLPPKWSDPDNWKDGVPGEQDDVIIGESPYSGTAHITVQGPVKLKSLLVNRTTLIGNAQLEVGGFVSKGAALTGAGILRITGGGSVTRGSTGESGLLIDGWTLNNEGALNIANNASIVFFSHAGRLNNSGTIDLNDGTAIDGLSGAGSVLANPGTLRKAVGTGKAAINALQCINTGQILVSSGRISFPVGSVSTSGSMVIQGSENTIVFEGASVALDGGSLTGDGEFIARGTTVISVNVDATIDILNLAANLTGPATLTVQKNLTWSAGVLSGSGQIISATEMRIEDPAGGAIRRISGRTLRNQGRALWASGNIGIQDAGRIVNEVNGEFTIGDLADKQLAGSYTDTAGFDNRGLLKLVRQNARKTSFYCVFSNSGRFEYASSVALFGGGVHSGILVQTKPASGRLEFAAATHHWDTGFMSFATVPVNIVGGSVDVRGPSKVDYLELDGGTLDGADVLEISASFLWSSGTIAGSGILRILPRAKMEWGGANVPRALIRRTIEIAGDGFWRSGNFTANEGAILRITETGRLAAGAAESMQWGTGSLPLFENRGLFEKAAGTGTAYIGAGFANTGIVIVRAGKIQFATGYVQDSGRTDIDFNAILQSGRFSNSVHGSIVGFGILSGGTTNHGTLRPGHSPGLLTLSGELRQMPDGQVEIEIGGRLPGTEHDQIKVDGAALLDGTLSIRLIHGFMPSAGDRFDVMTFQSRAGQFKVKSGDYLGNGLALVPEYSATKLTLVATAVNPELTTMTIAGPGASPASKVWSWPTSPGKAYQVEYSNDLFRWFFFKSITASGQATQLELPNAAHPEAALFYRIR